MNKPVSSLSVGDSNSLSPDSRQAQVLYRVGTLAYTRLGLVSLFVWLLWGDFCFTLMESVIPTIMPLKLQSLQAPNWLLGLIVTTIPSAMNFMVNPVVSFKSDRYRSRWGRRIPFLFWSTPFVTLFLVLMGYSQEIGEFVHRTIVAHYTQLSPTTTILILIAVLMVCFQFFNMFISSVYYYLFNDVVPEAMLARCMALFRVFGAAAGSAYSFFMFPYAKTHMRMIFVAAAVLYFVGFMLMCWKVKEGQYPPPPLNVGGKRGLWAGIKTYAVECFSHSFYWHFFLMNAFWQLASCMNAFGVLYSLSLGLTLKQLGYINGAASIITTVLLYPAGMLSDKFHPLRVMVAAMICFVLLIPVSFIYLFYDLSPHTVLLITCIVNCLSLPIGIMYGAAALPMYMKILPKDRYGQFGSADAMVRSITMIIGGVVAGLFMDLMKRWCGGELDFYKVQPFYYRFSPLWTLTFQLVALWFMYYLYRGWKAHGGVSHYVPPETGVERKSSLAFDQSLSNEEKSQ